MPRLLIVSVGTSLLTNRDRRPWGGWNPRQNEGLPDPAAVDAWLLSAEPGRASAETNTLQALGLGETDQVVLLHSDTPEGRFCSARLAAHLVLARCRSARQVQIDQLGYQTDRAQAGLKALVGAALEAIRTARREGLEPILCATGGFKAEIAFLNLLGALLEVEVCYIHELYREVVCLPRLPLAWDSDFVVRHRDFFEWIDAEPRPSVEVESWLKGRPELRPLVQDDAEGHTYLNAAGDLLFRAARERTALGPVARWPEPAPRTPAEKYQVSSDPHHRPDGWERFVARLCAIDCVLVVRYDPAAHGGPAIKLLEADHGAIGICFGPRDRELPLRVETTACGAAQTALVADYLRHMPRR